MPAILHHLARCYRQSAHGRRPAARDFTIDYEKFLRAADAADGDAREIAERELREADMKSNGLFRIDRHPRSGLPERIRLALDGGEAWLFQQIHEPSPTAQREAIAASFREMAGKTVPAKWQAGWLNYFQTLAEAAANGTSIQPFQSDPAANEILTTTLTGILHWRGPSLIRYASTAICGDSKQLQKLEPRLRVALAAITGRESLEDFGILRKPRAVTFHGPLRIHHDAHETDFSTMSGPVALTETNFTGEVRLTTPATICLTVENEDTFHELAASNHGVLLILTSYAGSAVRRMIELLPANLRFLHFGDGDPAGSDILRDLRAKSGRDIHPLLIPGQTSRARRPLTSTEAEMLNRLLDSDLPDTMVQHLQKLSASGIPTDFEQESIPVHLVWEALAPWDC
jgi:hypothetical protein